MQSGGKTFGDDMERALIRSALVMAALALAACSDGRGSTYSSARAQVDAPTYIPVTPGAVPIGQQPGTAVPIGPQATALQPAPGVLTQPIAITPGATPVTDPLPQEIIVATQQAPAESLTPTNRPANTQPAQPQVIPASAAAATAPAAAINGRTPFARGPIFNACRNAGRRDATRERCGCIQSVADQNLSVAQQQRGAGYFENQQGLQDARQSDKSSDEAFWKAWKAFGAQAGQVCRAT